MWGCGAAEGEKRYKMAQIEGVLTRRAMSGPVGMSLVESRCNPQDNAGRPKGSAGSVR